MIMTKFDWVFFDLDGTLVDSIEIMYDVYTNFLRLFDKLGTREEFEKLNGPSLYEIIIFLKSKYKLNLEVDELITKYQTMIEESYIDVIPFEDSLTILKNLNKKNYKLALVSSSTNRIVKNILKKLNWSKYFSIIITGDDIKTSKPSPDIYNLCVLRCKTNTENILVVEDSKNGYQSAIKAGLKCILIDKNNNLKSIMGMLE
jgi:HAD superfamily hydrolase (TIGR01509 family)